MRKIVVIIMLVFCFSVGESRVRYGGEAGCGFSYGVGSPGFKKFMMHAVQGVRINKYVFAGFGLGLDMMSSNSRNDPSSISPCWARAYAKLKGLYPLNDKVSLFCGGDIGAGAPFVMCQGDSDGITVDYRGGMYFAPEVGCSVKFWRRCGITFAVGYYCYNMTRKILFNGEVIGSGKLYSGSVGFNVNFYW